MNQGPFRYFVILGAMRTGSNFLERALEQFPSLQNFGELFNPNFIGGPCRDDFPNWNIADRDSMPFSLLESMIEHAKTEVVPGFRLFQDHDPRVLDHVLRDRSCAKIILSRNPLDSYVSLKIAQQTGQWILGGIAHRKSAKAHFSEVEFASFIFERERFYKQIGDTLNETGQSAFALQYTDLKSVATLNGLARYLGSETELERFDEPLKRQNPEALSKKVSNFDEMKAALSRQFSAALTTERSPVFTTKASNAPIFASGSLNLAFAPISGVPNQQLLKAIKKAGSVDRFSGPKEFETWMSDRPGIELVAMTAHPLTRAYNVFCQHVLPGDNVFKNLRQRLIKNFNLPELAGAKQPAALKEGFEIFLNFLTANLAGQTAIRIAREWDLQSNHIAALNQEVPISRITRWEAINSNREEIPGLSVFGLPTELDTTPLELIYDEGLERLCREAFSKDYVKLGYANWKPL